MPLCGRYTLFSSPARADDPVFDGELTDWSGDGQRALFVDFPAKPSQAASGPAYQVTAIPVPKNELGVLNVIPCFDQGQQ